MDGKEKCRALKQIRKQIAENNDIKYAVDECKHKGKCKGTCPKCEAEVRYLERELEKKRATGHKVAIAGVSLGIAAAFSACTPSDIVSSITYPIRDVLNIGPIDNDPPEVEYMGEAAPEYEGDEEAPDYGYENGFEDPDCETKDGNTGNEDYDPDDMELGGDEYIPEEETYELEGGIEYIEE